jgi:preprotein translocase subunit SecE
VSGKKTEKKAKVGEKVEDFIRESKEELKEQRKKLEDDR